MSGAHVAIISVYAPTHRAPVEIKDQFFDDLQAVISSAPPNDLLLAMGDFNVRVGCEKRRQKQKLKAYQVPFGKLHLQTTNHP